MNRKKEKNRQKKQSLGARVMMVTVLLSTIGILAILLNVMALNTIGDYTKCYSTYIKIKDLGDSLQTCYTEAKMYANLASYKLQTGSASEEFQGLQNAIDTMSDYCSQLDEIASGLTVTRGTEADTEFTEALTSYTSLLETVCTSADATLTAQSADSLASFIATASSGEPSVVQAQEACKTLIDDRIESLKYHSLLKISGTNVFDYILIAFNVVLLLAIFAMLYTKLIKPAKASQSKTTQFVKELHAGNGDLTERIPVHSNDEVGALSNGINAMIEELHGIMSRLNDHADTMHEVSSSVADSIFSSQGEIANVSSLMEEVAASTEESSASLNQVKEQVDTITTLVEDVYEQSVEQIRASEEVVKKIEIMRKEAMSERDKSDEETKQIVKALEVSIEAAREVQQINTMVDDILSISEQTNLLSLNASIEAARAGEAGKGFAVVAGEISSLAKDSSDAASHIQEISTKVIEAVNDLASKAEQMSQSLLAANAAGRENVETMTTNYGSDIGSMSESMREFSANSQTIQTSMQNIRRAVDSINSAVEDTAQAITSATNSTVDINNSMTSIGEEARKNLNISNELYNEVNKFKL